MTDSIVCDLDVQLAEAEAKARQLRQARQNRRQELQARLAALESELTAANAAQQKQPGKADDDPEIQRLRDEFNLANQAIREACRRHREEPPSERAKEGFHSRCDAELASLTQAMLKALRVYDTAVDSKTVELLAIHEETKRRAAAEAAAFREEIATVKAELQRTGSNDR